MTDRLPVLFVHIPKNGGNSIIRSLVHEPIRLNEWSTSHTTLARMELSTEELNRHYKFSVVRNPYDRIVSYYFFLISHAQKFIALREQIHREGKSLSRLSSSQMASYLNQMPNMSRDPQFMKVNLRSHQKNIKRLRKRGDRDLAEVEVLQELGFAGWLKACLRPEEHQLRERNQRIYGLSRSFLTTSQRDYLFLDGKNQMDTVLHQENLNAEYGTLCEQMGWSAPLGRYNTSVRKTGYREYYTEELKELVEPYVRADLETFGYSF